MAESEVARLMQQIAAEYQAAQSALTGLAITSRHEFITRKMENLERCREQLSTLVGEEESAKLVAETLADL